MKQLFKASNDGFSAFEFHKKCDNINNVVVIIKSKLGNVFGGYTD